jgi:hypothetical protein
VKQEVYVLKSSVGTLNETHSDGQYNEKKNEKGLNANKGLFRLFHQKQSDILIRYDNKTSKCM